MSAKNHKAKKNHKKVKQEAEVEHVNPVAEEVKAEEAAPTDDMATEEAAPIRADFPYSDVVRTYVPDAMAVADKVLMDWKTEGSFMNLGIENQYANMAVALGLQNAKKLEKKLEEKGVLPIVRMGFEVLKNKVNKQK